MLRGHNVLVSGGPLRTENVAHRFRPVRDLSDCPSLNQLPINWWMFGKNISRHDPGRILIVPVLAMKLE